MYGSHLSRSTSKSKEYRYNDIVSNFDVSFSNYEKFFLPKALPDGPETPFLFSSERVNGVGNSNFNYSPSLPVYLSLLGYTDFISFVQRYYDWLFTSNPIGNDGYGSGYFVDNSDLYKLIDIDKITFVDSDKDGEDDDGEFIADKDLRVNLLRLIASQFAEGLEKEIDRAVQSEDGVVEFLKEVREEFYIKKTNKEAIDWYFSKLYPREYFRAVVTEPKTEILRLDGGRPPFSESSDDIFLTDTNRLGEKVLQDSFWYQDYSYLLKLERLIGNPDGPPDPVPFDEQQYLDIAHPAGIKVIFDVTNEDYIPADDFDGEFGLTEITKIGNYNPYVLNDAGNTGVTAGCGMTLADGDSPLPAFAFPDWAENIPIGSVFGNINIGSFFFLTPAEDSPNTGLSAEFDPDESPCA
jgi:hypothetical protein